MFDSAVYDLGDLDICGQTENLVCEIRTVRDELVSRFLEQDDCGFLDWETCTFLSDYQVFVKHFRERLAQLSFEMEWGIENHQISALDELQERDDFEANECGFLQGRCGGHDGAR